MNNIQRQSQKIVSRGNDFSKLKVKTQGSHNHISRNGDNNSSRKTKQPKQILEYPMHSKIQNQTIRRRRDESKTSTLSDFMQLPSDSFPTLSKLHHVYNLEVNHNHSLNQDQIISKAVEINDNQNQEKQKKTNTKQTVNVAQEPYYENPKFRRQINTTVTPNVKTQKLTNRKKI